MLSESGKMTNDYFIVEKGALRKGLVSGWYGPLVAFPHSIFFISLIDITPNDYFTYPSIGVAGAYSRAKKAHKLLMKRTEGELLKLGDYIENINNIVMKKENSLKINKIDIKKCKMPRRYYLQTGSLSIGVINIKARDGKYEILFQEPKNIIPELRNYLIEHSYPVK